VVGRDSDRPTTVSLWLNRSEDFRP
jgi:hypothetical protein